MAGTGTVGNAGNAAFSLPRGVVRPRSIYAGRGVHFSMVVPDGFDVVGGALPHCADDLGDFRVGLPWVLGYYGGMVVLPEKDESFQKIKPEYL